MVGGGPTSARPGNPSLGYLYYDTNLSAQIVWNGTTWQFVSPPQTGRVGFGPTASRPANPAPGFLYFDTDLGQEFAWSGTAWVLVGPNLASSMVGYGKTINRPSSPQPGFLYYDIDLRQEFCWDGGSWILIGPSVGGAPPTTYDLITSAFPPSGGSVVPSGTNTYTAGSAVAVQAVAGVGYEFTNWSGDASGSNNPITVTMATAKTVVANFTSTVPSSYSVNFTAFNGQGVTSETQALITGFVCHNTSGTDTVATSIWALGGGALPPGVTYTVVGPSSNVIATATSAGGESQIGVTFAIPTNGGYTVVVSKSGGLLAVGCSLLAVAGPVQFHNASVRASVYGAGQYPPDGFALQLQVTDIVSATSAMMLYSVGTEAYQPLTGPNYSWWLQGNTTDNPVTFVPGTSVLMLGHSTKQADVRLEFDSV